MRDWFARDRGSDSINSTGGSSTHSHTTPTHGHTIAAHSHATSVGVSTTSSFERPTSGDLGNSPTTTHTHSSGNTGSTAVPVSTAGSGNSSAADNTPPYTDVHFVRLDGVSTTPITVPQITSSQFAETTISAPTVIKDQLVGDDISIVISPDRSFTLPRLSERATLTDGGLPQVSTTEHGMQQSLSIPIKTVDMNTMETILAQRRVWYAPLDGTAGWYAPAGWTVSAAKAGIRTVTVTLVRDEPPLPSDPQELL
jgi:hypothetical protein